MFAINWLSLLAIGVSLLSVCFTWKNYKRATYDDKVSFNIVQNLWSDEPHYILYNESKKKLRQAPNPTYLMLIPSKVYFNQKDISGNIIRQSIMVFSPVSYTYVLKQLRSGKSIDDIETSYLPLSFFAKKGERDIIKSEKLQKCESTSYTTVETLPMLVILSEIVYQFWGSLKEYREYILTTPIGKYNISSLEYDAMKQYIRDNYKEEVVNVTDKECVYKKANEKVIEFVKQMDPKRASFLGGVDGGYGNILKKINQLISPEDPLIKKGIGNYTKNKIKFYGILFLVGKILYCY